jgi:hypothetical protein
MSLKTMEVGLSVNLSATQIRMSIARIIIIIIQKDRGLFKLIIFIFKIIKVGWKKGKPIMTT